MAQYRINVPTLAIIEIEGKSTTVYVPVGETITLKDVPQSGARLVDVEWDDAPAKMFVADLVERGSLVTAVAV